MITLSIIVAIVSLLLIFAIFKISKLIKRSESSEEYIKDLEETVGRYDTYVVYIRRKVLDSYTVIKQLDSIGAFESDDETGVIFKNIKSIIESLNGDFEWLNQESNELKREVDQNTTSQMKQKQQ